VSSSWVTRQAPSVPDGSDSDTASYSQSTNIAENLIMAGVILFLTSIMVCAVLLACTAYFKPQKTETKYVVQSGYLEVRP